MIRKCYRCKYQWTAREIKGIDSQQDYRCRKCGAWTTIKDGKLVAAHIVHGRPGPKKKEIEVDPWVEWTHRMKMLDDAETAIRKEFHRRITLWDGNALWNTSNRQQFWRDVQTRADCADLLESLIQIRAAQILLWKEWKELMKGYLGAPTEQDLLDASQEIKNKYDLAFLHGLGIEQGVNREPSKDEEILAMREDGVMYVDYPKGRKEKESASEAFEGVEESALLRLKEESLEKGGGHGDLQVPGRAIEPQSPVPCHGRRKGTHHGKGKTKAHSQGEEKASEGGVPSRAHKRHRRLGRGDSIGPGPGKAVPTGKKERRKEMVPVRHMTLKQLEEEEP